MYSKKHFSWGRISSVSETHQAKITIENLGKSTRKLLTIGAGRSYGDSGLNQGEAIFETGFLGHLLNFDERTGVIECSAGITVAEILNFSIPRGWFLPVCPGTSWLSLGGAIANDVHGKNHDRQGTFGCHIESLRLLRSDLGMLECSKSSHSELFSASIGGLGLTGMILSAKIRLRKVSSIIVCESRKFSRLDEVLGFFNQSIPGHEYCVAWIDANSVGEKNAKMSGVFHRGFHHSMVQNEHRNINHGLGFLDSLSSLSPNCLLNPYAMKIYNQFVLSRSKETWTQNTQQAREFLFPLDQIPKWNRLYGPRGLRQHQSVIPLLAAKYLPEFFSLCRRHKQVPFLAVLKRYSSFSSPGLLSFPMEGWSLALDFPMLGASTNELLCQLDQLTKALDGRLYPAKDSTMTAKIFQGSYSQLDKFIELTDPKFSSNFWRRVCDY